MYPNTASGRVVRQNPLKLRPPRSRSDQVPRDAFCRRVEESRANLVLVTAPAGYGKSTALSLLFRRLEEQGQIVGWLTIEPSDNDVGRLAQYLWLSLGSVLPDSGAKQVETPLLDTASATANGLAYELLDTLAMLEAPFSLFIDEFEHITSPDVMTFITDLVAGLNEGQRVILGSRHKTMLPLGRMRVQGKLLEMEASELRFSTEETRSYILSRLKIELLPADLAKLQEGTDGWAAALQLTTAALMGEANPSSLLQGLTGPSRGLADYLAEDVLSRLPERQRFFLIQSSMFESFCSDMCNVVFECTDSAELIAQIERDNLFLQIIDVDGQWYRYHPLFRDYLQSQLANIRNVEGMLKQWHLRSAKWLDQARRGIQAIEHALAAGAPELAAELMAARAADFIHTGQLRVVSQWIESLPDAVVQQNLQLAIAGAYSMVFLHKYKDASRLLAFLKSEIDKSPQHKHDLLVLEIMLGAWSDHLPEAVKTAANEVENLTDAPPYVVGLIRNAAAYYAIAIGDYFTAHQHLIIAKRLLEPINAIHALSYSQCFEGVIDMLQGNVIQANARFNATLTNIIGAGYRFTNSTAVAAAHLIEALYESNDLDSAEILVSDYLPLIRDCCLPDDLITTYRIAARILFIRGKQSEALETLDYLQDMGDLRGIPRLAAAARQGKLRVALRAGDFAAANRLLTLISSNDIWERWNGLSPYGDDIDDPFIARTRIALVSGNGPSMLSELQDAIRLAEANNRTRRSMRLRCLLAQALESARRRPQALDLLEKTLTLAQPKGLFRVFADDSWLLAPLLEALELRSQAVPRAYITELINASAANNVAYVPSTHSAMIGRTEEGGLSQRELQILRLVAEGSSNKELSRKLFVSENTVETHLRRIYSKLGTKNRTQAVSKAREKGML
ncbi:LuxR C-terminal-related transcriptional regulator [Dechloromonas sp. CZR5]|uniref:LuxR C-terminal-related transcriptional regulator n=1 Tax=Dechloromonas sp. CZR5 TaxID=2608630 RepID=UPI00123D9CC1|nr:LuxR C-terminal-related transcriptional regulator [Dechloromonas sp. CZR5]